MSLKYNEEFKYALRDIVNNSFKLENQFGSIKIYFYFLKITTQYINKNYYYNYSFFNNKRFKILDRVRCTEWVHKLAMLPDDSLENIKIRNDYAQYLRIMLRAGVLHGIFSNSPPTTLMPFPEAMVRLK